MVVTTSPCYGTGNSPTLFSRLEMQPTTMSITSRYFCSLSQDSLSVQALLLRDRQIPLKARHLPSELGANGGCIVPLIQSSLSIIAIDGQYDPRIVLGKCPRDLILSLRRLGFRLLDWIKSLGHCAPRLVSPKCRKQRSRIVYE